MRLTVISHSLVAQRQAIFFDYLNTLKNMEVQQIYPAKWHRHTRRGGFKVAHEGNLMRYHFIFDAFKAIEKFQPDLIYCQNEAYCTMTYLAKQWAKIIGSKFAYFVWENVHRPKRLEADVIIAGNKEAAEIHGADIVIPQVGIDCGLFRPMPEIQKDYDLIFVGRHVSEKGVEVIKEAIRDLKAKVFWGKEHGFIPYRKLPGKYNRAKIHLNPSIDTKHWKEQFAPYTNVEALSCGLTVITSNSSAIVEWLSDCPGVIFVSQGNADELREAIVLVSYILSFVPLNLEGRKYVIENFSKEVVAHKLLEVFRKLC